MTSSSPHDPDQPSERRKGKAGIAVVGIVLAVIVVIFVGYNIAHVKTSQQEQASGAPEHTGLN
jgi:uncharacterized integral membrane protein